MRPEIKNRRNNERPPFVEADQGTFCTAGAALAGFYIAGLFLTPPVEKTKTQAKNSTLNLWEDFPSHVQNSRKN